MSEPFAAFGARPRVARVLAVCSGNVCRSPVMERLLRLGLARAGLDGIAVDSAGTRALVGNDMEPGSRALLIARGADAENFRSTSIDDLELEHYDLILTASEAHRAAVVERAPAMLSRTFPLRRFRPAVRTGAAATDHGADDAIVDPYRQPPERYHLMERQIVPAVHAVVTYLEQQE